MVTVLEMSANLLLAIVTSGRSPQMTELVSLPRTVNLLFTLLSHLDPHTNKFQIWPPTTDKVACCTVIELLRVCWSFSLGVDAFALGLRSRKNRTRRKLFVALVY